MKTSLFLRAVGSASSNVTQDDAEELEKLGNYLINETINNGSRSKNEAKLFCKAVYSYARAILDDLFRELYIAPDVLPVAAASPLVPSPSHGSAEGTGVNALDESAMVDTERQEEDRSEVGSSANTSACKMRMESDMCCDGGGMVIGIGMAMDMCAECRKSVEDVKAMSDLSDDTDGVGQEEDLCSHSRYLESETPASACHSDSPPDSQPDFHSHSPSQSQSDLHSRSHSTIFTSTSLSLKISGSESEESVKDEAVMVHDSEDSIESAETETGTRTTIEKVSLDTNCCNNGNSQNVCFRKKKKARWSGGVGLFRIRRRPPVDSYRGSQRG